MCYDIAAQLKSQLSYAERYTPHLADEIKEQLLPYLEEWEKDNYHVNGFEHPKLVIFRSDYPKQPDISRWGLIPHWAKDKETAFEMWNKTINARVETIFEKPSFKESAKHHRGIICVDGFFEHQHRDKIKVPYFIHRKDKEPIMIGVIFSEYLFDENSDEVTPTFSIVTTKGKGILAEIHNNPKLEEPRMPLMLSEKGIEKWMDASIESEFEIEDEDIMDLSELTAYSVKPLRGKQSVGNTEEALEPTGEYSY